MQSYWDRVRQRRVSRRRAIAATGATAAAAAFLVACGGDDNDPGAGVTGSGAAGGANGASGSTAANGGLLTPIVDSTSELVRGGTGTWSHATPVSLDPHLTGGQVAHGWHAYSQLFRVKEGHLENASGEFEGELAESFEFSPGNTTITVRLKQGVLFAPQAPVNARAVDAGDVAFSWERYSAISPRRAELANDHNPNAPVLSVTNPDETTVVIQLKEPNATILGGFAGNLPGTPYIVPREVESAGIDLKGESLGSGAFYLTEYEPGFRAHYVRNPGFKAADDRDLPYIDEMEYVQVPDYAAFLAQFKAGQVLDQFFGVLPDDILVTKEDVPELEVYDAGLGRGQTRTIFGQMPDSVFRDERVRQAVSMALDRDLFTEVAFGIARFEDAGIPIDKPWDSAIPAGSPSAYAGWWLDPRGADFGPNARYYQHNVDEARKLLNAATGQDSIDADLTYAGPQNGFPASFYSRKDIIVAMLEESGLFRFKINEVDFPTVWNPQFRANKGEFAGMAMELDTNELDPAVDLFSHYNSGGSRYFGGDAEIDRLTSAMLQEFDRQARIGLAHELQRYEGRAQFRPAITSATLIRIGWPAERNRRVWRGSENRWHAHTWLDMTKAPFA